jgi:GTP-binding protein
MKLETVAIVGRPNVGKSALFNRIVGRPVAIVADRPGVTRDRHTALAEWGGRRFWLVDTGGFEEEAEAEDEASLRHQMQSQVRLAVEEAARIILTVDGKAGLLPADRQVAKMLHKSGKPVWLAVNKVDTPALEGRALDFVSLGFEEPVAVSALHGLGVDELLDRVCQGMEKTEEEPAGPDEALRIAIVGRPNVGKSSMVNQFLGREAMVVNDLAGTTRDAVDTEFLFKGKPYVLVDTAGLRQKGRIADEVEKYSTVRALRAIKDCDVAVLVLDAKEGVTEQDERIGGLIQEAGRGCVLAVNKWDLVEKDDKTFNACLEDLRRRLPFLDYAPVVFVSAKTRQRLPNLMELAAHVGEQHAMRISTGVLNRALEDIVTEMPPPTRHGKPLKVFFLSQTGVKPPAFALFVNDPKLLHFSYMRAVKNRLRSRFGFEGTPLFVMLRRRK